MCTHKASSSKRGRMLEHVSMKTFVKNISFGALTHDVSRVLHDQDVPRRVDRVWFVIVK